MHRSNGYSYSTSSRNHGTSSAFSPNANPNEDWTKISDLAERRRIQNRIAQRNYRKKLKRRLEDLEKRAASASESPERTLEPSEPVKVPVKSSRAKQTRTSKSSSSSSSDIHHSHSRSPASISTDRASYDSYSTDERGSASSSMFSYQSTRQLSTSPPPLLSYPSYSSFDTYPHSSYAHNGQPQYHSISVSGPYSDLAYHSHSASEYSSSIPSLLPVMHHQPTAGKKYPSYGPSDDEIISPFNMSYASMAGIDLSPPTRHSSSSSSASSSSAASENSSNIPVHTHTLPSIRATYPQFQSTRS